MGRRRLAELSKARRAGLVRSIVVASIIATLTTSAALYLQHSATSLWVSAATSASQPSRTSPAYNVSTTSASFIPASRASPPPAMTRCTQVQYLAPVGINYSVGQAGLLPHQTAVPGVPGLTYFGNLSISLASTAPISLASNSSGFGFGLFYGNGYYLAVSRDFVHWNTTDSSVIPKGYRIFPGKDLGVTRSGVILVSATRLATDKENFTVFRASHDYGRTFQTVLNVSLRAKLQNSTHLNSGPGEGFWHGIPEAGNGYLFAGLYNPQGLVFRSVDNGWSWQLVFNASAHGDWHNEIHDLEVSPLNDFIYATTDDEAGNKFNQSIWVSPDHGDHWKSFYSAMTGGAGLPLHLTPTTIGFLNKGKLLVLGLEGYSKSPFSRTLYILDFMPDGCPQAIYRVTAPIQMAEPFITWWIHPNNQSSVFVLTHSAFLVNHTSGIGLFVMSEGKLTPLMSLTGSGKSLMVFLQMTGPSPEGSYQLLVQSGSRIYCLVLRDSS